MAITRRQHHKNSHYPRSGTRLHTSSSILTPAQAHVAPKTRVRRFPKNSGHIGKETLPKQPQEPEPDAPNLQAPSPTASCIGEEPADSSPQNFNTSQGTSPPPETQLPETLEEVGSSATTGPITPSFHNATVDSALIQPFAADIVPADPGEVGVPKDGEWEIVGVFKCRYCVLHKEDEWLLRYANNWMYVRDFKSRGVKGKLEAKLEKYNSNPWEVDVSNPAFRAECTQSLWDQLDTPIQRGKIGDKSIYQCRWKLYWTPQSNIDNLDWVRLSYEGAK